MLLEPLDGAAVRALRVPPLAVFGLPVPTRAPGPAWRQYYLSPPPWDWTREVEQGRPLPLLLAFHDERSSVSAFLDSWFGKELVGSDGSDLFEDPPQSGSFIAEKGGRLSGLQGGRLSGLTPHKLLIAAPQGVSLEPDRYDPVHVNVKGDWNDGHRGFAARTLRVNDVAFVDAMISEIIRTYEAWFIDAFGGLPPTGVIDIARIYAIGVGNGGSFCHKLACELPTLLGGGGFALAGFCSIGGTIGGWANFRDLGVFPPIPPTLNDPNALLVPPPPLDVLLVHSVNDLNINPLLGAAATSSRSEAEVQRLWSDLADLGLANDLAPVDFGLESSRLPWAFLAGAAPGDSPTASGPRSVGGYSMERWMFHDVSTVTTLITAAIGSENYLDGAASNLPNLARTAWEYFLDPRTLA